MSERGQWGDPVVDDLRSLAPQHPIVVQFDVLTARIVALEAAARAATDALIGTLFECPACETRQRGAYRQPHRAGCPIAALAALLEATCEDRH